MEEIQNIPPSVIYMSMSLLILGIILGVYMTNAYFRSRR